MATVLNALVQYLQADTAGVMSVAKQIIPRQAPEGDIKYPVVIVTAQQAPEGALVFQGIAFEEGVYLVKACDKNISSVRTGQLNQLIRARLDQAAIPVSGYATLTCYWQRDVDYTEVVGSTIYHYEGGLYYIAVEAT